MSKYEELLAQQHEAAQAFVEAKAHYERLTRETKEAYAQENWGVPYSVHKFSDHWLVAVCKNGEALYERGKSGRQAKQYLLRRADGTVDTWGRGKPDPAPEGRYKWLNIKSGTKYVW